MGLAVRLVLAFATLGSQFDIQSYALVYQGLISHPLHVYAGLSMGGSYRWPYPPGLFPWIFIAGKLNSATGLPLHGFIKLPSIAADLALAWLVQLFLARRGASERTRLVGASLILLGPVFVGISGYAGQFDSLAILPAFGAVMVWTDGDPRRRALFAGVLIGVGTAIKTVPIFMLIALLPTTRTWREALTLVIAAALVPILVLAPYLITQYHAVRAAFNYNGGPGFGGITLALQPDFARRWLTLPYVKSNGALHAFLDHARLIDGAIFIGLLAALRWRRVGALTASVIVWLTLFAFGPGFFFQYLVWGLPFFIAAGYFWQSTLLQLWVIIPGVLFYAGPWRSEGIVELYATMMLLLWLGYLVALGQILRNRLSVRRANPAVA